jgi:hypothetical protein
MTRDELLALAARVEAATGVDQILDADILLAASPELAAAPWERVAYSSGMRAFFVDRSDPDRNNVVSPPAFTSSLDAAASLVPEGYAWAVYGGTREEGHATAYCVPKGGRLPWPAWVDDVNAATPALALTAAALRAKAQEVGDE